MATKSNSDIIRLNSTGTKENGKPTGYFKVTTRCKRNLAAKSRFANGKLKLRKYDPRAFDPATGKRGMYVEFVESTKFK